MAESGKNQFLEKLAEELSFHPDKAEILDEYEGHVYDLNEEHDGPLSYAMLVDTLGDPRNLAGIWKEEATITQNRLQLLFVCCNIVLFLGGSVLTLGYHLFEWGWLQWTWRTLTSIPMVIVVMYLLFWGLLGYEIGKTFGTKGLGLLKRTFMVGVVPNLILMMLTVFNIIPHHWFAPLITREFILTCVVGTILLYPMSWFGYRWGRRMSV
ncbi:membrane protein [Halobacillus sp. BBL2006]|uniref:HAAS signaling domain-containing protein n=1 Tax=Halobacillus sp. BBL2006 TaxID=1543706 RepID=UPI0005434585|nr:membrane protein [Halobacillus sp. BBL2006]KHE73227.1 membrane protein [Halobacillus sp. BBL2006]